ncbi:MAG: replication restart DNA helicase PriA [Synechococcales cyanobacterium RM1_1_8]|nr:replication restart DNA helicase PriA [Synechococcales cyanobacterium RM1_1_8]
MQRDKPKDKPQDKPQDKHTLQGQVQRVCCPNCGCATAERHYLPTYRIIRTQCGSCDYLLVTGETGNVIEAYAPGQNW